jgi:hypothetical protein
MYYERKLKADPWMKKECIFILEHRKYGYYNAPILVANSLTARGLLTAGLRSPHIYIMQVHPKELCFAKRRHAKYILTCHALDVGRLECAAPETYPIPQKKRSPACSRVKKHISHVCAAGAVFLSRPLSVPLCRFFSFSYCGRKSRNGAVRFYLRNSEAGRR